MLFWWNWLETQFSLKNYMQDHPLPGEIIKTNNFDLALWWLRAVRTSTPGLQKKIVIKYFSHFSAKTYVVGTQKNHLNFKHQKTVKTDGNEKSQ